MANEFVARKGLISSGSINVSGSVTASFFKGDGSQLINLPVTTVLSSSVNIDTYTFNGDGSTTNYILSHSYDINSLIVSVDGLTQTKNTDYNISASTVTFVDTPPSASNILVRALVNVTQNMTGSFSGSFFGIISTASFAQTALFVLSPNFSGSFTGSFVGDGSELTFTTLNTSQSSDSQLLIGNKYNNYQYKQTTIFKNGDVIISGSTTITEDGVLVLKPRSTPSSSVAGTIFYSSSGELYLGT